MRRVSVGEAGRLLVELLDEGAVFDAPVKIVGGRNAAVLVSESIWRSMEDSLYLCNIPGMKESIVEGMSEPIADCEEKAGW
ncbi:MAG: type II toxin-antitoxin system prevent-host-death family antitoxin [Synergistaceae bacterium]|nr:type II toxin-antitoxin system prevent-host-death family antitoxin [Synergistaceae bacterium]